MPVCQCNIVNTHMHRYVMYIYVYIFSEEFFSNISLSLDINFMSLLYLDG